MKKLTNKSVLIIDIITLIMVMMFPLVPSHGHELFMTFLCLTGVITIIGNISIIKFNYKDAINVEETFKLFIFIWAKMLIFCILINLLVQTTYLDKAIDNHNSLNIYSGKAIYGWELMVNFYTWILFYVPIVAATNAFLFVIATSILMMIRNKETFIVMNKLVKYLAKKINEIKNLIAKFNLAILNMIKNNKKCENISYLTEAKDLFINNKKAQLPPLLFF